MFTDMLTTIIWDPKLSRLEDVPLLAGCDRREIREIGRLGDLIERDGETVLIEQGRSGSEVFIIVDGTVTVSRDGEELATLGPGEVVGEVAVLDRGRRTARVTANTPVEVMVFDPGGFASLLREAPVVTRRMLIRTAARLRSNGGKESATARA